MPPPSSPILFFPYPLHPSPPHPTLPPPPLIWVWEHTICTFIIFTFSFNSGALRSSPSTYHVQSALYNSAEIPSWRKTTGICPMQPLIWTFPVDLLKIQFPPEYLLWCLFTIWWIFWLMPMLTSETHPNFPNCLLCKTNAARNYTSWFPDDRNYDEWFA